MPQTARLAIPLIAAGQSQKDVTHNEAVLALERLTALSVVSDTAVSPPASPADGGVWIVPAAGVAGWGQAAGTLMHRDQEAWLAVPPQRGQMAFVSDSARLVVHAGGRWKTVRQMDAPQQPALPVGGAIVDAEARAMLAAIMDILALHGLVMQTM